MLGKQYHHGDVFSEQVDLAYDTVSVIVDSKEEWEVEEILNS